MRDDADPADPTTFVNTDPAPELSPAEQRESEYQDYKKRLARAYLDPHAPRYWDRPARPPVERVLNPNAVTPEEIEQARQQARADFAQRISRQWQSNLFYL
jgi:hypothetical protein